MAAAAAGSTVSTDELLRFTGVGFGMVLIPLGNIMPKARRNAVFCFRTKWSMANDAVWQKSQRFGGAVSVACGVCMIAASVFATGARHIFLVIGIMALWLTVCVAATYRYYVADGRQSG